eukprot:c22381_g2_i1 orf=1-825(-)
MESDSKNGTGLHRIVAPEQAQRLGLQEYAAIKLMQVAVERDAAILERNNAMAEKKAAFAERDFAVLQRDIALAERDNAIIERDAAVAALKLERGTRSRESIQEMNGDVDSKEPAVSQMNAPDVTDFGDGDLHAFADDGRMAGLAMNCGVLHSPEQHDMQMKTKENSKPKQSKKLSKRATDAAPKPARKRKRVDARNQGSQLVQGVHKVHNEQLAHKENNDLPLLNLQIHHSVQEQANARIVMNSANKPIPYCSCTGLNQQCYRWGNGGWQSACCT